MKLNKLLVVTIVACTITCLIGCSIGNKKNYGVFIGINGDDAKIMKNYNTVVIEPSEFSKNQIKKLHKENKRVYGYLNVGSVEKYRPYFEKFKNITIGKYENWEDELWVDVSQKRWQKFIVDKLGKKYYLLGIDGFFIDNTDVYYNFYSKKIYNGLCDIIKGLNKYGKDIIINGGDSFVLGCIKEGKARKLFNGINQETVFTSINFDEMTFGKQKKDETVYFKEYLNKAKKTGLDIYLLEYGAKGKLEKQISNYCKKQGFQWYNAKSINLDG